MKRILNRTLSTKIFSQTIKPKSRSPGNAQVTIEQSHNQPGLVCPDGETAVLATNSRLIRQKSKQRRDEFLDRLEGYKNLF